MGNLSDRVAGKIYSKLHEVEENIRRYRRRKRRKQRKTNRWFTPYLKRRLRDAFRKDLEEAVGRPSTGATIEGDGFDMECEDPPKGLVGSGGLEVECADIPGGYVAGDGFDIECEDIDDSSD